MFSMVQKYTREDAIEIVARQLRGEGRAPFPVQDIANMIGMSRGRLNELAKKFNEERERGDQNQGGAA